MNGIYLHIPFCRQACRYCDFFFTVSLKNMKDFVKKLREEIILRKEENGIISQGSIYLGGGTPSLLSPGNLGQILETINNNYSIGDNAEVTIECNPDDINPDYLKSLIALGFNRISIGIQSFHDRDLKLMRRSHDAKQAEKCIIEAANAGFENISADLIYGIPDQAQHEWEQNIQKTKDLPVDHISAYHLTFEPGTIFEHWLKKGKLVPVDEDQSLKQYRILRKLLIKEGFDQYEISNFARKGKMSIHNLVYWTGEKYLGFGPAAHSYDGTTRSWNISSLKDYLAGIETGNEIRRYEKLSTEEKYHDYLITSLRTKWGAGPDHINDHFGEKLGAHFNKKSSGLIERGLLFLRDGKLVIYPDQWLLSDHILKELFIY